MQSLIRSKSAGVTGGRGTAGAGPGRDLLYCGRHGGAGLAPCIVSVLGLLGGVVYACVFWFLIGWSAVWKGMGQEGA